MLISDGAPPTLISTSTSLDLSAAGPAMWTVWTPRVSPSRNSAGGRSQVEDMGSNPPLDYFPE